MQNNQKEEIVNITVKKIQEIETKTEKTKKLKTYF